MFSFGSCGSCGMASSGLFGQVEVRHVVASFGSCGELRQVLAS